MSAKRGVEIDTLDLSIRNRLVSMSYLWRAFFGDREDPDGLTLTSTYEGYQGDGVHGKDSLHYKGRAIDLRTKDVSTLRVIIFIRALRELLGQEYDIVNEGDHIHVEYDPSHGASNIKVKATASVTGPGDPPVGG